MGLLSSNDIRNFKSLYTLQLRHMLSSERQIIKGLQRMIEHTNDGQLLRAFQDHQQETVVHEDRLKLLLMELQGGPEDKKCAITAAMLDMGENIVKETEAGPVRDAGLLAAAQNVEHFEIATYGTARDWATLLDLPSHVDLLQRSLDDEKHADKVLNSIAQRANSTAAAA